MKRTIVYYGMLLVVMITGPASVSGQHDLGMYNMQIVPQRIFQNPAFIPDQKLFIGLPVLSGVQSSFSDPFTYNDVIERDSYDSVTFKVEDFLGKLSKNDQFTWYSDIDILSVGSQVAKGKFFLGFSVRERICQQTTLPANLMNLLWYGNAAPQFFGQEVNVAPAVNFTAYDEWGVSFSGYALKKKMTWGARLKYLSGRINVTTTKSQFDVYTDTSTYQLYMRSDVEVKTSGLDDVSYHQGQGSTALVFPGFQHYFDQSLSSLVFSGNNGAGVDLGLSYQFNPRIGISASVLDIGFINWNSKTMDLVSQDPGKQFIFNGLTLNDFVDMIGNMASFGRKLTDSILDLAKIDTVYGNKYTSWLPARYNLGGSYSLNDRHRFNLLLNGISWNKKFYPALSVSYYYQLHGTLGLMVSYNIFNRQFTNFGAGLSVSAGPVQFYAVSDNVPGLIWYKGTNNSSIQVGINISIRRKKQDLPAEVPVQPEPVPDPGK